MTSASSSNSTLYTESVGSGSTWTTHRTRVDSKHAASSSTELATSGQRLFPLRLRSLGILRGPPHPIEGRGGLLAPEVYCRCDVRDPNRGQTAGNGRRPTPAALLCQATAWTVERDPRVAGFDANLLCEAVQTFFESPRNLYASSWSLAAGLWPTSIARERTRRHTLCEPRARRAAVRTFLQTRAMICSLFAPDFVNSLISRVDSLIALLTL